MTEYVEQLVAGPVSEFAERYRYGSSIHRLPHRLRSPHCTLNDRVVEARHSIDYVEAVRGSAGQAEPHQLEHTGHREFAYVSTEAWRTARQAILSHITAVT
ncbi:hypothetical protein [Nocardia thailandica]|uniref:hypothetical protein n=1 Tax=Nocardia thailandica TaxID=257275 RepID=UPI0002DDFD3E|nr:hypothetical protein [Nocardia thailandica]